MLKDILIINTGGTFNKKYNPITGENEILTEIIPMILKKWLVTDYSILNIIQKDSLDFSEKDRKFLLKSIKKSKSHKILIVHGTDTMDLSASFLNKHNLDKVIVFTGAMTPYSASKTEAVANFASALGFLSNQKKKGIFISMNGLIKKFNKIKKNRTLGKFE